MIKKTLHDFKHIILICFLGLFSGFIFSNTNGPPPEIGRILERGKLRVAMVANDQMPFFFHEGDSLVGTDVDLALGIADALGVGLEISREAQSFNDLIPLVSSDKVDVVISKLSRTLKRSQQVIFSEPYFRFHQALAFNRVGLAKIADTDYQIKRLVKDFSGKIGVIGGSSYANYARLYFPNAEVIEYPVWEDVIKAVIDGDVLAAYRDDFEIKKVLKTNPDLNLALKLVILKDLQDNIAMAFNWSSASLRDFVNIYLDRIQLPTTEEVFARFGKTFEQNKINFNK